MIKILLDHPIATCFIIVFAGEYILSIVRAAKA
jgi:hypothetical protein